MFKARVGLLALTAVFIASAAASAVASAQEGPVWHVNSKTFLAGEKASFTGENYTGTTATMSTTVLGKKVTILCKAFATEGLILGGNPGKGEGSIEYKECGLEFEAKLSTSCVVTLEKTKVLAELDHLLGGEEPKPILVDFYPASGSPFSKLTIKSKEGESCPFTLSATEIKVAKEAKYGVACADTHQEVEATTALIMCTEPAITEVEQEGKAVKVGLEMAGASVTFKADMLSKLTSGLLFGAWQK
jgi:hypothetical protein